MGRFEREISRVFLLVVFLLFASKVWAYQLSPLSVTYSPNGIESTKAYTITNDSDSPIAIEMKVYKRFVDINGKEYTEEAPQYFSIQPQKMIIKPQSTQIIRVQYRGPRTVTKEMSFRIVSEQIAYSQGATIQQGNQMINFLFVYSTAAYVEPTRVIERVSSSARVIDGKLELTLENTGSVHQLLDNLSVALSSSKGNYTLSDSELEGMTGVNLLTDSKLIKTIECPEQLKGANSFDVDISYDFTY